jgi:trk system potassium uptake protein TrkH
LNKNVVFHAIGSLLLLFAACLLVPLIVSLADPPGIRHREIAAFGITIAITGLIGVLLRRFFPRRGREIGHTEGFAIVSLGWIVAAAFGCLPFLFAGAIPSFVDAYFETMSGFTTTGATILTDIEGLPYGILFWRSFTHWLGGMGIVLLSVAILPALGAGGTQLFKAEVPGIMGDRLTPRIAETAKLLWKVYILLTILEIFLLMLGGMNLFESACHTFGTMATGGFSVKNASIGHYESAYIHWVIIVFMFLAGCNFVLHFHALRGRLSIVGRNSEFRVYVLILVGATVVITAFLLFAPATDFGGGERPGGYGDASRVVRDATFQAVSIVTTTGYATADFDVWPDFCRMLLLLLMFVGGCSGSTGGSMKVGRVMILLKYGLREVRRLIRPLAIFPVRQEKEIVEVSLLDNVVGFCVLFVALFVAGSVGIVVLETAFQGPGGEGIDLVTAASSVAATIGNIGPGLGRVGATCHYAWFTGPSKVLLSFFMLLGRLEVYCVLVLFAPRIWRR